MLRGSFTLEQWLYGRDDTVAPPPVDARIALAEALVSAARINGGISILACFLTLVLLWGYLPYRLELLWFAAVTLMWAHYVWRMSRRRRHAMSLRGAAHLLANAWKTALVSGLSWGCLALTEPWLPLERHAALEVIAAALCAGSAATLAPAPSAARAYMSGVLGPFIIFFLWQFDLTHAILAVLALGMLQAMLMANRLGYRSLVKGVRAQRAALLAGEELRDAQREWRELSETAEAFALFNHRHRLLLWNDAYARLLSVMPAMLTRGMSWGQIHALSGLDVLPESRLFSPPTDPEAATVLHDEFPLGLRWYRSTVRRLANGDVAVSHVDITALKNREAELLDLRDELEAARDEAEAASQAKSRFLANMSHELRTPLNAVIGFSDIMVQDCATGRDNSPMHAQYARTILESGQHLLSIVEDMLDLARIEAGKLRVLESNVDLVDLVRSASAMALGRGTTTGVTLRERLPEQPLPMRLDARLIRQALINLVGNALKFSRPNSEVTIALTGPDDAGGDVRLIIADQGIGIPDHLVEEVLKPFAQVEDSEARRYGGVGLGLPLARQFIELQGGQLRLESTLGEGTRAVITLPAARVVPDDATATVPPSSAGLADGPADAA